MGDVTTRKSLATRMICMGLAIIGFIVMVVLIAAGALEVAMGFGAVSAILFLYAGW